MALSVYKLNPASANTFGGDAFGSATQFSVEQQGEEQTYSADGVTNIQMVTMDNLSYVITVQCQDTSTDFKVGDCGALVLNAIERTDACSQGSADTITFTFSNAICTGATKTVSHTATSESSFTFRAYKPDGTDPLTIS